MGPKKDWFTFGQSHMSPKSWRKTAKQGFAKFQKHKFETTKKWETGKSKMETNKDQLSTRKFKFNKKANKGETGKIEVESNRCQICKQRFKFNGKTGKREQM